MVRLTQTGFAASQAVLAGLGIGIGMRRVADATGDLVRVLPEVKVPSLPLWVTAHRELRGTPREGRVRRARRGACCAVTSKGPCVGTRRPASTMPRSTPRTPP
jgi:DNA-binding transcriptional LysR family regulator